jgi:hypothetical protein
MKLAQMSLSTIPKIIFCVLVSYFRKLDLIRITTFKLKMICIGCSPKKHFIGIRPIKVDLTLV